MRHWIITIYFTFSLTHETHETPQNPTGSYKIQRDTTGSYETTQDHLRSHKTPRDPTRPHKTSWDPTRPHKTGVSQIILGHKNCLNMCMCILVYDSRQESQCDENVNCWAILLLVEKFVECKNLNGRLSRACLQVRSSWLTLLEQVYQNFRPTNILYTH